MMQCTNFEQMMQCTNFEQNRFTGFQNNSGFILWQTDRLTDGQTPGRKQYVSPRGEGGDIIIQIERTFMF